MVLLDQENREVARSLSDGDGSFSLSAPVAGFYSIRSERIGYRAFTSGQFELAAGEPLVLTLKVLAQAIVLAAVEVQGEDRCRTNPDEAEETGLVWQEIRKALAATAWDGTQELARYRAYGYRRGWDLSRQEVLSEDGVLAEGYAGQPYSSISVQSLMEEGFIVERDDSVSYNLPDAGVLQDESFLAAHCFHVVRDPIERTGQIGLSFEPMSPYGLPDVRGALWLDEATSELRVLELSFTQLPHGLVEDRVGGTVEFLMLPSGAWIVRRWQVRTPAIRVITGGTRETGDRSRRLGITGFHDTGGEVLEITTRDGVRLYPPGLAHLTGTVYDSSRAGPLAGATIAIEGTVFWGSSNEAGAFHVTAPLAGAYAATLSHPWLDSIGVAPLRRGIQFFPDATDTVSFVLPHADSVARRVCAYDSDSTVQATVVGLVRGGSSGRPASGTAITASWQILVSEDEGTVPREVQRTVRTDETGSYVLCGLPVGIPVTINANGARSANILFPRQVGGFLLFARGRAPDEPYTRTYRTSHRTWKVDLLLTGTPQPRSTAEIRRVLSGYVTDGSTGRPLSGVTLLLNNSDSTVTRIDGTFDMIDVEWRRGNNTVTAHRNGYLMWMREIWLDQENARVELSIQLRQ